MSKVESCLECGHRVVCRVWEKAAAVSGYGHAPDSIFNVEVVRQGIAQAIGPHCRCAEKQKGLER